MQTLWCAGDYFFFNVFQELLVPTLQIPQIYIFLQISLRGSKEANRTYKSLKRHLDKKHGINIDVNVWTAKKQAFLNPIQYKVEDSTNGLVVDWILSWYQSLEIHQILVGLYNWIRIIIFYVQIPKLGN